MSGHGMSNSVGPGQWGRIDQDQICVRLAMWLVWFGHDHSIHRPGGRYQRHPKFVVGGCVAGSKGLNFFGPCR